MDPIKANRTSPEAEQHKQAKVNSVIPQVSLTGTQFKETSIWDVSSQLMKLQTINIQENTTTINEVLILGEISSYRIPTKKFRFNRCLLWGLWGNSHFIQKNPPKNKNKTNISELLFHCKTKALRSIPLSLYSLYYNRVNSQYLVCVVPAAKIQFNPTNDSKSLSDPQHF